MGRELPGSVRARMRPEQRVFLDPDCISLFVTDVGLKEANEAVSGAEAWGWMGSRAPLN